MSEKYMILKWCNWLYLIGIAFLITAIISASIADMPQWYSEAIYESVTYLFFSFCILAVITNFLARFTSNILLSIFVLSIVLSAVIIPLIYVNGAAFLGGENAKFESWHLLSMFTAIYQVQASIFFGGITGIFCCIIGLTWKFKNAT